MPSRAERTEKHKLPQSGRELSGGRGPGSAGKKKWDGQTALRQRQTKLTQANGKSEGAGD